MDRAGIKRLIKNLSIGWGIGALVIFGLAVAKVITLDQFQLIFPILFVVWVVAVTVLTKMLQNEDL